MSKTDYKFGANILENLTTGMYQDPKVIYREYIQNSCDAIDKAVKEKILDDANEGLIEIWLDYGTRIISIEDNGTGIPANEFQNALGDIADSDKKIGENKGFRGIGRLCGLAYCKEVIFSSSTKGEDIISFMRCDAQKMRHLLSENVKGNKLTAVEIMQRINKYSTSKTKDIDSHFFKVELLDINPENTDLLDENEIRDYLSFVAPVPYRNFFLFRKDIYDYSKKLGYMLDEYVIKLEGEPIFKEFKPELKKYEDKSCDKIFGVDFRNFYDIDDNLLAWMWFGLSEFRGAIPKTNKMRGIRLRKENIQIGNEDALQKLFKEDRGNSYFVGEVFAISNELVPNSQRDYFNENPARAHFEKVLRNFFNDELSKIYYEASKMNSAYKKIDTYGNMAEEFKEKTDKNDFVNESHREDELYKVESAKKEAEAAQARIEKVKEEATKRPDGPVAKVINRIETQRSSKLSPTIPITSPPEPTKLKRRADKLLNYNRNERKLISRIFELILSVTDRKTAEMIISKIEDGLSQ
jgi:molecular chaperone HtpG